MMTLREVDQVRIWQLRLPLQRPYHLSLGEIAAFDTILVEVRSGERLGYGEATYVAGYTDERIETAWEYARMIARNVASAEIDETLAFLRREVPGAAFTATAFATALEMLVDHPALRIDAAVRVPLLGLLNAEAEPELSEEIGTLIERGFATLKIKVGFDVDTDLARIHRIQRANAGRCRLRLDANQGYSKEEGMRFAAALDPDAIELFEQPCAKEDWEAAVAVSRVATVPLMLDESIYSLGDIERAASLGAARFIKLKLMKAGSLDALAQGLRRIRALGMEPVLGNGVATALSNWMEACVARGLVDNALESNGFLKPRDSIVAPPLRFQNGAVVLEPGFTATIDRDAVEAHTVASEVVEAR